MTQLARQGDEARALVRLGFDELHGFTRSVGTMEREIAARTFGYVPAGKPIRLIHDTVAGGVVGALGGATAAAGRGAEALVGRRRRPQRPLSATLPGGLGLAVLNGLVGDRLEREGSPLQEPISVRVDGLPVPPERDALARAFPEARPRLVVFVHGLMGNEVGWRLGRRQGREPYGARLAREIGCTPLYIRYNSGRHISENGRSLADLIETLVAAGRSRSRRSRSSGTRWAGSSRAARATGGQGRRALGRTVRHVVSLGSPHMGAPLEQAVHVASYAFGKLPETRALGRPAPPQLGHPRPPPGLASRRGLARPRSGGAARRGVRGGAAARRRDALLRSATVTRSPRHPVGRVVGDTLVLSRARPDAAAPASSASRTSSGSTSAHHHIALLNHPAVYEKLREWLR